MSFVPKPGSPKTYEADLGDNGRRSHAHVRVGNENNADAFEPHVLASKWDGEAWISMALRLPGNVVFQEHVFTNGLIELNSPILDYRTYVLNDGVMEIEIELRAKPLQGLTLEYDVTHSAGVQLHYQGPVTEEDGLWDEENQRWIAPTRPPRVVDSYAVYMHGRGKSLGKYRGGKLAHLYSWVAIDANEDSINLPLQYDEQTGILSIEVPQSWTNTAAYPITLIGNGDTIGFNSCGGSQQGLGDEWLWASGYTDGGYDIGVPGTYTIDAWGNACGDSNQVGVVFKPAIYDDDGQPTPEPGSVVSYDGEHDTEQAHTCYDDDTPCTLSGFPGSGSETIDGETKYWIVLLTGTSNYDVYYDDVANYKNEYKNGYGYAVAFGAWPNGTTSWDGHKVTAFIDYSAPAAGAPTLRRPLDNYLRNLVTR